LDLFHPNPVTIRIQADPKRLETATRFVVLPLSLLAFVFFCHLSVQAGAPLIQREFKTQAQRQLNQLLQTKSVEFKDETAELTDTGRQTLNQVIPILAALPLFPCEIRGHNNSAGDTQENMDLSDRRARAVQAYLVSKGIPAARLDAEGYGEEG